MGGCMNQELKDMLLHLDIYKRVDVPKEEMDQISPEELRMDFNGNPYFIQDPGLSTEEVNTMLRAQQTLQIKMIKNIVLIFFICYLLATVFFQIRA